MFHKYKYKFSLKNIYQIQVKTGFLDSGNFVKKNLNTFEIQKAL